MFELIALILLSQQPIQPFTEGVASYYTSRSSSPVTASGETLNDDSFTCAMQEGTFGDYFLIVADNGKSVVCRLNDRGPFAKGRVVDLSRASIRQLDTDADLLNVSVYRLGSTPPASQAHRNRPPIKFLPLH